MIDINLVIEDELSGEIIETILKQLNINLQIKNKYPDPKREKASSGNSYIKKKLPGFNNAARETPYLVLTDLDRNECAPSLIKAWLPHGQHPNLLFRVAVREVETWVMADRTSFANFLGLEPKVIPQDIDNQVEDPKEFLLKLVKRSRKKTIKTDILPKKGSTAKVGRLYNAALISFLHHQWKLEEARKYSDSLERMANALDNFKPRFNSTLNSIPANK